jgi:hypothetical protein
MKTCHFNRKLPELIADFAFIIFMAGLVVFQSCAPYNLKQADPKRQRYRWPRKIEVDYQDFSVNYEPETEVAMVTLMPPRDKTKLKTVARVDFQIPDEYGNLLWVKLKNVDRSGRFLRLQKGSIAMNVPGNYFFIYGKSHNIVQIYIDLPSQLESKNEVQIALTNRENRVVVVHRKFIVKIAKPVWQNAI